MIYLIGFEAHFKQPWGSCDPAGPLLHNEVHHKYLPRVTIFQTWASLHGEDESLHCWFPTLLGFTEGGLDFGVDYGDMKRESSQPGLRSCCPRLWSGFLFEVSLSLYKQGREIFQLVLGCWSTDHRFLVWFPQEKSGVFSLHMRNNSWTCWLLWWEGRQLKGVWNHSRLYGSLVVWRRMLAVPAPWEGDAALIQPHISHWRVSRKTLCYGLCQWKLTCA